MRTSVVFSSTCVLMQLWMYFPAEFTVALFKSKCDKTVLPMGRLEEMVLFNRKIQEVMNSGAAVVQADHLSTRSLRLNDLTCFLCALIY